MPQQKIQVLAPTRLPLANKLAATLPLARLIPRGSDAPSSNVRNALMDGLAIGFASAANPFLPVLLTRLGATNFTVGLLTAMPAFAGFLFALPISRFLSRRRDVVRLFAVARFATILPFALTGLVLFLAPALRIEAILVIWALATLPQTLVGIAFTIVMAGVAGPQGRFSFMSRRWSLLGLTNAISVAIAGLVLDHIEFPLNYQLVFVVLSLGGVGSAYFANQIKLPVPEITAAQESRGRDLFRGIYSLRISWAQVEQGILGLHETQRPTLFRSELSLDDDAHLREFGPIISGLVHNDEPHQINPARHGARVPFH